MRRVKVNSLLRFVDQGRFAVPKLQREFVWDGPKAAKLLDSMLKGMPIGVIMIWETPTGHRLQLRQQYHVLPRFNARNNKVWFLIDGQQRVSVLHHVREGSDVKNARERDVDFRKVVLSFVKEDDGQQIRYRKAVQGLHAPLCDVLHAQWRSRLSHLSKNQLKRARRCREQILNYPIHKMFITSEIDEIRETFLRINTQGMKITAADAIFTRAEELDLRDIRHEVRQHLDHAFKDMPEMPILFAMAALHGATEARGEVLRRVIERLEKETRNKPKRKRELTIMWNRLCPCFGKAVDFLRDNFSVLNRDYLYSDYMISMLALFYYRNGRGPSARQKDQITKWFWATAVGGRYSGRNFNKCIPEDIKFFERLVRHSGTRFVYRPQVEKVDVRKSQYASRTGITTAFYCMMLKRGPVSLIEDGLNVIPRDRYSTKANRSDRHHIFPRRGLVHLEVPANLYNSICNICLLTAEENQSIGSKRPENYLRDVRENHGYFAKKMSRHLIPAGESSGIWTRDLKCGFNQFIKERTDLICEALEVEAGTKLFRREN